ncbi:MAG: hypothetical protein L3K18_08675 [Thermoplasmata archaeon]|nr:hypothetical protein [Thermoplasmata archaeon]
MSADLTDLRLTALEGRVTALEAKFTVGAAPISPAARAKPESIREFLNKGSPKSAVDIALAVAVWMERNGNVGQITTDDLVEGFGQAKEPLPTNPADLLYQNGRRGYMATSKEKKAGSKAWYVTNTGEKFVDGGFKL